LSKLRCLRIYGKKISELPGGIGECRSLEELELQCPRLKTLPPSFSKLGKMRAFKFFHCNLTSIPDYICGWSEFKELSISMDNTLQGPYIDFTEIPKNIGNLKKLKRLTLENTGVRKIPASLCDCPLEQLTLTGGFKTIPETFGKLSELKELKLYAFNLRKLPESFGNLSSLEIFEIHGKCIEVPESFGNLSTLKELSFHTSELELPKTLGKLFALEKLYIDDDKMDALPKSIGKCINLKQMSLHCDELQELPSSIRNLKNLEEFSLDTFKLKNIPDVFNNLTELKSIDIFSGALTSIPQSIGTLKKLKTITLDAYNVNNLPESLRNLSYIKHANINIDKMEQEAICHLLNHTKQNGSRIVDFDELKYMSYKYRWKIFGKFSLKELESLICSAPSSFNATEIDKEIVKELIFARRCRLNRKFSWTAENIKRIVRVSDKFLAAWEEGFIKAKAMVDTLYEKETDKDNFWENHDVEIILHPYILVKDKKTGEWDIPCNSVYSVLTDYLPEWELTIGIGGKDYNPATKDENGFREDTHVNHDLSWNIEGFGDIDLREHYICYAIHILYSHNEWANEDILKINNINTEIKITHLHNGEVF
jgi:Leucine-rich repeat (LRR) protein